MKKKLILAIPVFILLFILFISYRVILIPLFWIKIDNFQGVVKRFKDFNHRVKP